MKNKRKRGVIPRMRNGRSRILLSITPRFAKNYEGSQCWHGCDKVSVVNGKGGGGS